MLGISEDGFSSGVDEDIHPRRRRRDGTPFGISEVDGGSDAGSDRLSVVFHKEHMSDDDVGSGSDGGAESGDEGDGSVGSGDEGFHQYGVDGVEIQRELDEGEELAENAREEAVRRDKPDTPSDSESDIGTGRRRKRKRGDISCSDDSDGDVDSVDRMVPFMVHAFCQGCRCKQSVYILGPVKKRRVAEADRILLAMQDRYKVSLVRGERRMIDKPKSLLDSLVVGAESKGVRVSVGTGFSR